MFKTLLQINKESLTVLGFILVTIMIIVINLWILVPSLLDVLVNKTTVPSNGPINTQTVNEAIKYLNNE